jgi:hypothetical protein
MPKKSGTPKWRHPLALLAPSGNPLPFLVLAFNFLLAATPRAAAQDTVFLKNGRKADCQVLDFTADTVKISWKPTPGSRAEFRAVPLADVDFVEFAPLPGEAEARAQAVKEGRSEPLLPFWGKRVSWLGRPRCDAGELGLTYAELLSRKSTPDRLERALKVYEQIESTDWSPERRGRAQAGKLRIMLRQGRVEEVRPLAEALLAKNGDPRVLIDLRHVLGETAAAALSQLEKDHPRWKDEDDLIPQHDRLLGEAFDGYLFPHLFYGTEEDLAARGLWAAAQLAQAQGEAAQASDWALDLTKLYPNTPETAAAAALLAKQPATSRPKPAAQENAEPVSTSGAKPEAGTETDARPDQAPEKPKRKSRSKSKSKAQSKTDPIPAKEADPDDK